MMWWESKFSGHFCFRLHFIYAGFGDLERHSHAAGPQLGFCKASLRVSPGLEKKL